MCHKGKSDRLFYILLVTLHYGSRLLICNTGEKHSETQELEAVEVGEAYEGLCKDLLANLSSPRPVIQINHYNNISEAAVRAILSVHQLKVTSVRSQPTSDVTSLSAEAQPAMLNGEATDAGSPEFIFRGVSCITPSDRVFDVSEP
jgi:hypothetical protein